MKDVKITALRRTCYPDLMELYENPLDNPCDIQIGNSWLSINGEKPENFCDSAWGTMETFVKALATGGGDFYDGWMKNPYSAMISCNDGFRPVSFYLETLEERQ